VAGNRILLVEDDPGHQHLISRSLTSGQRQVELEVVSTGRDAVHAIRNRLFDCVLLDFNLPDARADELLPVLAKDGHSPPVVVISSSRDQDTAIKSMRNGSVDFLPKMETLDGNTLWHRVDAAVRAHRKAQAGRRKIERRMAQLARLAEQDPLTGLSNRRCLNRLFEKRRITRDRRGCVSVIMLDLDHFKRINDRQGHDCGDRVLRVVADVVRARVGSTDVACRYGGEEFVVIKAATSIAGTRRWTEALREKIARLRIRCGDRRVAVTVSIGVVNCASACLGPETISRADRAMYLAKQRGRNVVCTWQMVVFHEAVQQVVAFSPWPLSPRLVEERLRNVLMQTRDHLGPTQWNHLTTHAEYVSGLAVRLGKALGLDEATVERLRVAGLCHDLGKFLIPEDVLAKTGTLAAEERALLERHTADGAEMSLMLGLEPIAAEYVRFHHARWAGRGAVNACDSSIPLGARILAVADALIAMTSPRPYQPRRSFSTAARELRYGSGRQFDPDVVRAVPRALMADLPLAPCGTS
jgi:diguanylate cyclase (GGDEF)-like protein